MARQVITKVLCDRHANLKDEQVEGEELDPITIGSNKPRVLALCGECRSEINIDSVIALVLEWGIEAEAFAPKTAPSNVPGRQYPTAKSKDSPPINCPACLDEGRTKQLSNRASLTGHLRQQHGKTLWEQYGENPIVAIDGTHYAPAPNPLHSPPAVTHAVCPECDEAYDWPKYARPVATLGVHRRTKHGIVGASTTAAMARAKNGTQVEGVDTLPGIS